MQEPKNPMKESELVVNSKRLPSLTQLSTIALLKTFTSLQAMSLCGERAQRPPNCVRQDFSSMSGSLSLDSSLSQERLKSDQRC